MRELDIEHKKIKVQAYIHAPFCVQCNIQLEQQGNSIYMVSPPRRDYVCPKCKGVVILPESEWECIKYDTIEE